MQSSDIPKFTALIAGIGELYDKAISEELTGIYWKSMRRFSLDDVESALNSHVLKPGAGQFFPKPADVVLVIEGSGEDSAMRAWGQVHDAVRHHGAYQCVAFDDPIIHAVIKAMGGWVRLCEMDKGSAGYRMNDFIKIYQGYANRPPESYPKYLPGRFPLKEGEMPRFIGDSKKAEQLFLTTPDDDTPRLE